MAPKETIEFDESDRSAVLAAMATLADGSGWINLQPVVDPDDLPPQGSVLFGLFSARGPVLPLCTWTPPGLSKRETYVSLGVQHSTGTKAAARLADRGVPIDERWRVLRDSPKGGLVVAAPADHPNETILDWLLRAGAAVCPAQTHGRWVAFVYKS